jgi:ATP-dependent Lon protease
MPGRKRNIIRRVKRMLLKGPEYCFELVHSLSYLINEFDNHTWDLSSKEKHFIRCLITLRMEIMADTPFIKFVQGALQQNHRETSDLFEEIGQVKEDMLMYEDNLAVLFDQESTVTDENLTSEIKADIQENIVKLLKKRQRVLELKAQMKDLGEDLSELMDRLKTVDVFKKNIRDHWKTATDAAAML